MDDIKGIYFDIQRYALHVGPGIRTNVFLKGCPLSCTWCHNPEGQSAEPEIHLLPERCIGCGACLEVCPNPLVEGTCQTMTTDESECIKCAECVDVCAAEARRLVGKTINARKLTARLERERPFYEESFGGVTFSGGEPFMQGEFLIACLKICKERGIHTVVDTSGYVDKELVLTAARYTDLFLYDLKIMNDALHRKYVGVPVATVLENLKAIDAAGKEIWIRIPLVPGVNDDNANLEAIGSFVASLRKTVRVNLLPFNKLGSDKYRRRQVSYQHAKLEPPSSEELEQATCKLAGFGLNIYKSG
ncbi:MAG: glycyl-radical enzyme activating protein [Proteobacteria bacterium]|nr:glycyl-radical enzyme activating protein [Pseudomonadota bacterium]